MNPEPRFGVFYFFAALAYFFAVFLRYKIKPTPVKKKILILLLAVVGVAYAYRTIHYKVLHGHIPPTDVERTRAKAQEALTYCKAKGFNTDFCLLADMSIHSGRNRLFLYDFKKNTITRKMLVGHGCGNYPWSFDFSKEHPSFSNVDGSHCSALGKYKIGQRGYSNWGINVKYELHGLEATNSNALARFIVFHSWEKVADEEVYPNGTAEGWGCPTISNANMRIIDPLLQKVDKPVLFWMYQ